MVLELFYKLKIEAYVFYTKKLNTSSINLKLQKMSENESYEQEFQEKEECVLSLQKQSEELITGTLIKRAIKTFKKCGGVVDANGVITKIPDK